MELNSMTIDITHNIDLEYAQELTKIVGVTTEAAASFNSVYLDLKKSFTIDQSAFREIMSLSLNLKKKDQSLYLTGVNDETKSALHSLGLDSVIRISEHGGRKNFNAPKSVDVKFVNSFVSGILQVLRVQCQTEGVFEKPMLKENYTFAENVAIAGVIGITSDSFTGSISICFPESTFLKVMGNMMGEEYNKITPDLEDGAGELLNIAFGAAKTILNEKGYKLSKALPTVVRGEKLFVKHLRPIKTIVLPFGSKVGNFYVEIGIENEQ